MSAVGHMSSETRLMRALAFGWSSGGPRIHFKHALLSILVGFHSLCRTEEHKTHLRLLPCLNIIRLFLCFLCLFLSLPCLAISQLSPRGHSDGIAGCYKLVQHAACLASLRSAFCYSTLLVRLCEKSCLMMKWNQRNNTSHKLCVCVEEYDCICVVCVWTPLWNLDPPSSPVLELQAQEAAAAPTRSGGSAK